MTHTNKTCEHIQILLPAFLDGELPPDERALVREHLAGCEACRAEHEDLARTLSAVRGLLEPDGPSDIALERVRREARDAARRTSRPSRAWAHTAAAAVLAFALITAGLAWMLSGLSGHAVRQPQKPVPASARRSAISHSNIRQEIEAVRREISDLNAAVNPAPDIPYALQSGTHAPVTDTPYVRSRSTLASSQGWDSVDADLRDVNRRIRRLNRNMETM